MFSHLRAAAVLATTLFFANSLHAASVPANGALSMIQRRANPVVRDPTDFDTIFSDILERAASSKSSTPIKSISKEADAAPPAPNLFEFVFGPINAANNANGYMGFVFLDTFDVNACAQQCNVRAFNNQSGPCIFFNIWTPVVNGTATSPVCSMYNTVTDSSTATNTGQGPTQVTSSIGYSRINLILDPSFELFTCADGDTGSVGCPPDPFKVWSIFPSAGDNAIIIDNFPAHSGTSSALIFLGASSLFSFGDELTYVGNLETVPGQRYTVSIFYTLNSVTSFPSNSNFNTPLFTVFLDDLGFIQVFQTSQPPEGNTFFNVVGEVDALGSDTLFIQSGTGVPHSIFIDDVAMFPVF